jgi:membrane associated rhomboid family serine protease
MAFFVEGKPARQPILRAPASVISLIGVLVVAHVARVLAPPAVSERILNDYALVPARYAIQSASAYGAGSSLSNQLIGLFSHMLLHANAMHIAVNCVWLLAFGPVVARRFGAAAFFVFFALCGLAGALFYIALNWGDTVGVIGASGAISGLMGAGIRMMRLRQPQLDAGNVPLMPIFSSQVLGFSAIWLAVNLLTGLFGFATTGQIEPVAWQDHMGGYLAGLLLAGLFDRLFRGSERHLRRGA